MMLARSAASSRAPSLRVPFAHVVLVPPPAASGVEDTGPALFEVLRVAADGDCLFRAVAAVLARERLADSSGADAMHRMRLVELRALQETGRGGGNGELAAVLRAACKEVIETSSDDKFLRSVATNLITRGPAGGADASETIRVALDHGSTGDLRAVLAAEVGRKGSWGGEVEVHLLAAVLHRDIVVARQPPDKGVCRTITVSAPLTVAVRPWSEDTPTGPPVFVLVDAENTHFDGLLQVARPDDGGQREVRQLRQQVQQLQQELSEHQDMLLMASQHDARQPRVAASRRSSSVYYSPSSPPSSPDAHLLRVAMSPSPTWSEESS